MQKDIVFFDLETTGLDITTNRIIEICMVKLKSNGTTEKYYSKVCPGEVEISEEAYKKHGMSLESLQDEPLFKDIVDDVVSFLEGCDLGGYNLIKFDLPFLLEEILRNGKSFNYRNCNLIDPLLIYNKMEPRDLESAYKKYTGKTLENAHAAEADVLATVEIFKKQKELYSLNSNSEIESVTVENRIDWIDLSGKFKYNNNKEVIFNFGKHQGKLVKDICAIDNSYLSWIINSGTFPTETKLIAKKLMDKYSTVKN